MPWRRLPRELWYKRRKEIWIRDLGKCVRCNQTVRLEKCHIDHIVSGKLGSNRNSNLRTLCPTCHVLRLDFRHRGMISSALEKGLIPPNWRELVWDN